jgi:hypothetical protein
LTRAAVSLIGVCLLLSAVVLTASAGAIVPPRNCGNLAVHGRTYNIKADQIRCRPARRYAKRYLVSHWKPSGYSCRTYRHSALRFRCAKGIHVYYAIRR